MNAHASTRAVFLDKDGTLVHDVPYNADPLRTRFYPEARESLRLLALAGYRLVVISNQPGVALGLMNEEQLDQIGAQLRDFFRDAGTELEGFYYCPHHPDGKHEHYRMNCECRKPAPGLLLRAAADLGIDLTSSWMVGDILNDVEAGNRAGCRTVFVDRGNETEWLYGEYRQPTYMVTNMLEAADHIRNCDLPRLSGQRR